MENIIKYCLSPSLLAKIITNGKYKLPPHIKFIDYILFKLPYTKNGRIIVSLPPRHGKSELISKYFPMWYICTFAKRRVILTSYESTFANYWGRKVKELVEIYGETLFGVFLRQGAAAMNFFELSNNSSMTTAGAGGAITGKGADLLIIDDPIKNDAEANSPTIRDNVWDWFVSTAYTRIEPGGSCVIVMTRWHPDDLIGRLMAEYANDWQYIKLPAIAGENDPLGRLTGEPLWQERFPIDTLLKIKQQLGSYWFQALYQQEPVAHENTLFKRENFKFYKIQNEIAILDETKIALADCIHFATADLAVTTKEHSDYTVFLVYCQTTNKQILIRDVIRLKTDPSLHLQIMKNLTYQYHIKLWAVEAVQYQALLSRLAMKEGIAVREIKPFTDKFTRALPMAALLESGRIYFPANSNWFDDFISELITFPNGKHDDQVDAFSLIAQLFTENTNLYIAGRKILRDKLTHF